MGGGCSSHSSKRATTGLLIARTMKLPMPAGWADKDVDAVKARVRRLEEALSRYSEGRTARRDVPAWKRRSSWALNQRERPWFMG